MNFRLGTSSSELRRAARDGDGWLHGGGDPADLPRLLARLAELRREEGTAGRPFEMHVISLDAYTLDGVRRLADQGVTDAVVGFRWPYQVGPDTEPLADKLAKLRRYADDVIAKVRASLPGADIDSSGWRCASENQGMEHLSRERLEAALGRIRDSPRDVGRVVLVVRRPVVGLRDLPDEAMLDLATGLAGDNWLARGSKTTPDGSADLDRQVTVMNARVAELVAGRADRMPLAGDQLYVDLDLSVDNLKAGSLLAVGQAVLQVSHAPHLGCAKFVERFGADAMRFVNSRTGRRLRLRGMNTRVVQAGLVRLGDVAAKVHADLAGRHVH